MDLQNNHLKNLLMDILSPLAINPELLVNKVLSPAQSKNYYMILGLMQSPLITNFMPALKGFDPNQLVKNLVYKLEDSSEDFWAQVEDCLRGVLDGIPEEIEKAKDLLKVV